MREHILREIRRLAKANGGRPPGRRIFEKETAIRGSEWLGVYWARWSDALAEAGFEANEWQGRLDRGFLLEKMAQAVRHYGKVPSEAELRMYRKLDAEFPSHSTPYNHFGTKAQMVASLHEWTLQRDNYADVAAMLPEGSTAKRETHSSRPREGFVYLIRSGAHYKLGRSDEIERRVKEITVALPEALTLVHTIRTDDPSGIEAYWHRRFADRRANGEWFKLAPSDVAAFKRRKYQ